MTKLNDLQILPFMPAIDVELAPAYNQAIAINNVAVAINNIAIVLAGRQPTERQQLTDEVAEALKRYWEQLQKAQTQQAQTTNGYRGRDGTGGQP